MVSPVTALPTAPSQMTPQAMAALAQLMLGSNQTTSTTTANTVGGNFGPLEQVVAAQTGLMNPQAMQQLMAGLFTQGAEQIPALVQAYATAAGGRARNNSGLSLALNDMNVKLAQAAAQAVQQQQVNAGQSAAQLAQVTRNPQTVQMTRQQTPSPLGMVGPALGAFSLFQNREKLMEALGIGKGQVARAGAGGAATAAAANAGAGTGSRLGFLWDEDMAAGTNPFSAVVASPNMDGISSASSNTPGMSSVGSSASSAGSAAGTAANWLGELDSPFSTPTPMMSRDPGLVSWADDLIPSNSMSLAPSAFADDAIGAASSMAGNFAEAIPVVGNVISAVSNPGQFALSRAADYFIPGAGLVIDAIGSIFGSGGCYITEAVTQGVGGTDDAEELQVLRGFRDDYMLKNDKLIPLVAEYEKTAPDVVIALSRLNDDDRKQEYQRLYKEYIKPAADAVKAGNNESALQIYAQLVADTSRTAETLKPVRAGQFEQLAQIADSMTYMDGAKPLRTLPYSSQVNPLEGRKTPQQNLERPPASSWPKHAPGDPSMRGMPIPMAPPRKAPAYTGMV